MYSKGSNVPEVFKWYAKSCWRMNIKNISSSTSFNFHCIPWFPVFVKFYVIFGFTSHNCWKVKVSHEYPTITFISSPCPTDNKPPASLYSLPYNLSNLVVMQISLLSSLFHSSELHSLPIGLIHNRFTKPWSNLSPTLRIAPFHTWRKSSVLNVLFIQTISAALTKAFPYRKLSVSVRTWIH